MLVHRFNREDMKVVECSGCRQQGFNLTAVVSRLMRTFYKKVHRLKENGCRVEGGFGLNG